MVDEVDWRGWERVETEMKRVVQERSPQSPRGQSGPSACLQVPVRAYTCLSPQRLGPLLYSTCTVQDTLSRQYYSADATTTKSHSIYYIEYLAQYLQCSN